MPCNYHMESEAPLRFGGDTYAFIYTLAAALLLVAAVSYM